MSLRLHGDSIARPGTLDFAVNVWPERPALLNEPLQRALADGHRYPDGRPAREAIATRHGRAVEEVLLLNGACDAFWLLAQALRPAIAACIHPSFTEGEAALRATGADVVHVLREHERWSFQPDDVPETAELVVLGNPNNPTGALDAPEAVASLARPWRLVVVDESFMDFVPGETATLARSNDLPGVVVVRSLTKLWSLAGVRAGYLLAPAAVTERLAAHRQPWSVNSLACAALLACANDPETPGRVAAEVASARAELVDALRAISSIRFWPSQANFLLLQTLDGARLTEALAARGIAVRAAGSFPGLDDSYIRIAVRPRDDNAVLLSALRELSAR